MEEYLALATGLQFAYWFWNANIQPGMTRFSDKIGETMGEISSNKLYHLFGEEPPIDAQGNVDESETIKEERISVAKLKVKSDLEWNSRQFMNTTKRQLVKLLREPTLYTWEDIEILWQDYANPEKPFDDIRDKHGFSRAGVANELVMEAIVRGTLPQLVAAMRQSRL